MCKYIRFCKTENDLSGSNVFDVSRASVLGNPFTHIKDKKTKALYVVETRDKAIDMYSKYFDLMYAKNAKFKAAVDEIYEASKKYNEIYIGCYCKLSERCHGDIIIDKLTSMSILNAIIDEHNNKIKIEDNEN